MQPVPSLYADLLQPVITFVSIPSRLATIARALTSDTPISLALVLVVVLTPHLPPTTTLITPAQIKLVVAGSP